MHTRLEALRRCATAGLVSLGLIAFGLFMTGREGAAFAAFRRLSDPDFLLETLPGSRVEAVRNLRTTNGLELLRGGATTFSVAHVVSHYEAIAKRRAIRLTTVAPYFKVERDDFGLLSWQDKSGWRCGVVAFPLQGAETRYMLFQGGAGPAALSFQAAPILPLGIEAPVGSEALFDLRQDDRAMVFYRIPGEPDAVLRTMEDKLERAGCAIDTKIRAALSTHHEGPVTIPFERGDRSGILTLQRGLAPNSTELSLILRAR